MDRLAIAAGIAQGIEKATANLQNIQLAKYKLKQQDESFQLDKKVKEAQLNKMEFMYGPEQVQAERDKIKSETKYRQAATELANIQIEGEKAKQERELKDYEFKLREIERYEQGLKDGRSTSGINIDVPGLSFKQPSESQRIAKSNAITMLNRGDFTDRAEAEQYLMEKLKVDVNDPDIQQALSQYKVKEEGKRGWFQKYPRKQKFGYTYEQREDGKWHRVE